MENLIKTQYEDDSLAELRPLESHWFLTGPNTVC